MPWSVQFPPWLTADVTASYMHMGAGGKPMTMQCWPLGHAIVAHDGGGGGGGP